MNRTGKVARASADGRYVQQRDVQNITHSRHCDTLSSLQTDTGARPGANQLLVSHIEPSWRLSPPFSLAYQSSTIEMRDYRPLLSISKTKGPVHHESRPDVIASRLGPGFQRTRACFSAKSPITPRGPARTNDALTMLCAERSSPTAVHSRLCAVRRCLCLAWYCSAVSSYLLLTHCSTQPPMCDVVLPPPGIISPCSKQLLTAYSSYR